MRLIVFSVTAALVLATAPLASADGCSPGEQCAAVVTTGRSTADATWSSRDLTVDLSVERHEFTSTSLRSSEGDPDPGAEAVEVVLSISATRPGTAPLECTAVIPPDAFTFDPVLGRASLRHDSPDCGGNVNWTFEGSPRVSAAPTAPPPNPSLDRIEVSIRPNGEVYRSATARGTVLLHRGRLLEDSDASTAGASTMHDAMVATIQNIR